MQYSEIVPKFIRLLISAKQSEIQRIYHQNSEDIIHLISTKKTYICIKVNCTVIFALRLILLHIMHFILFRINTAINFQCDTNTMPVVQVIITQCTKQLAKQCPVYVRKTSFLLECLLECHVYVKSSMQSCPVPFHKIN